MKLQLIITSFPPPLFNPSHVLSFLSRIHDLPFFNCCKSVHIYMPKCKYNLLSSYHVTCILYIICNILLYYFRADHLILDSQLGVFFPREDYFSWSLFLSLLQFFVQSMPYELSPSMLGFLLVSSFLVSHDDETSCVWFL